MRYFLGLWAFIFIACLGRTLGATRHSGRQLKRVSPSLDDLLSRLEGSIHEHTKRLQRGLPTIHYRTDEPSEEWEVPAVVQESWPDETHPEHPDDGTSDYVNIAPWTRGPTQGIGPAHTATLQAHDLQNIRLASANARWVKDNGKCELPLRRTIPVATEISATGRKFWPRCALLHRCGDDAGCCNSLEHTCAVAESEKVDLHFYVYEADRAGVQMLTFVNHTKCSCQPKADVAPEETTVPETLTQCKCPKHFIPVTTSGKCNCDCPGGKSTCRKYKRGKRYLSGTDIRCISTQECSAPTCEYGPFVLRKRRCTKRRERDRYVTSRK